MKHFSPILYAEKHGVNMTVETSSSSAGEKLVKSNGNVGKKKKKSVKISSRQMRRAVIITTGHVIQLLTNLVRICCYYCWGKQATVCWHL